VYVGIIGIEEAAVTEHKVEHRIAIAVYLIRVASKHVIHLSAIMLPARNLAVAVIISLAPRIG